MIEINLMPDVKQELLKAQRIRSTVISVGITIGVAVAGVVVLLALYVFGAQLGFDTAAQKDIDTKGKELDKVEDLSKMLTIQSQLQQVSSLNNAKHVTSRIFDTLAVVPPGTKLSSVIVDTTDGMQLVTIEGQAAGSYAATELYQKTLANVDVKYKEVAADGTVATEDKTVPLASNIQISDLSYGEDSDGNMVLRFKLTFMYAKELLSNNVTDVRLDVSKTGNVTDSYLNIPKTLFQDRAQTPKGGN